MYVNEVKFINHVKVISVLTELCVGMLGIG